MGPRGLGITVQINIRRSARQRHVFSHWFAVLAKKWLMTSIHGQSNPTNMKKVQWKDFLCHGKQQRNKMTQCLWQWSALQNTERTECGHGSKGIVPIDSETDWQDSGPCFQTSQNIWPITSNLHASAGSWCLQGFICLATTEWVGFKSWQNGWFKTPDQTEMDVAQVMLVDDD